MVKTINIINNQIYLGDQSDPTTFTKIDPSNIKSQGLKFFNMDQVDDCFNIISSPVRAKLLVGYFSTSQQVKFGKTKSGNTIYQVTTFDPSLPYFLVPYGGKLTGKIIVVFKFKDWASSLPSGEIVNVIGPYDDSNLIISLQYINSVYRKNMFKSPQPNLNPVEVDIKRPTVNSTIFSIDPPNCLDVDDAMSVDETSDAWIVGIYIAQPICWLSESELVNRAKDSFSTLYNQNFAPNNNLWGDKITEFASLTQNMEKPAYQIKFTINKKTLETIDITHGPVKITNSIKTDYDNCLKFPIIEKLFDITTILSPNTIDTHQLVSFWMIKANNFLGTCEEIKKLNIPYRVMSSENKSTHETCYDNIEPKIKNIFLNRLNESATYQIDNPINFHGGLEMFDYIHFTSPIRRIVDCLIHWCITYKVNFKDLLEKYNLTIDQINQIDSNTKKYHHNIDLLEKINTWVWFETDPNFSANDKSETLLEVNGWIYSKSTSENKWTIWFDYIGFQKVKMWDNKFNYLKDDKFMETINQIKIGDKMKFTIYKKKGFLPKEKILIVSPLNLL